MKTIPEVVLGSMTVVLVVLLLPGRSVLVAGQSTFLLAMRDMAPPPSFTFISSFTTTMPGCGIACFNASSRCIAFVWTPPPFEIRGGKNSSQSVSLTGVEGLCHLMSCLPHPASLRPSPGAQVYLLRGRANPYYGPDTAPASYMVACSYAYRVYSKRKMSYSNAEAHCAQDGATLIIIKDAEQERTVLDAVNQGEGYWIGLTDRKEEGEWRWADNSSLGYTNWDRGQPNNYMRRRGSDQDCAMVYRGAWNDHHCRHHLRFVCQVTFVHL